MATLSGNLLAIECSVLRLAQQWETFHGRKEMYRLEAQTRETRMMSLTVVGLRVGPREGLELGVIDGDLRIEGTQSGPGRQSKGFDSTLHLRLWGLSLEQELAN